MGNLHLVTGHAGTAHVTAADHASLNAAIFGDGKYVLDSGGRMTYTRHSNNKIQVNKGDIILHGRHIILDSPLELTIDNGSQGVNRNDLIVVRYTKDGKTGVEDCNLVVIKGEENSGTALDPAYHDTGNIFEGDDQVDMPLYRVRLNGITIAAVERMFDICRIGRGQDMSRNYASATGVDTSLSIKKETMTPLALAEWRFNSNNVFTFADGGVAMPFDGIVLIYASVYFDTSSTTKPEQLCVHVLKNEAELCGQTTHCESHTACHMPPVMVSVAAGDVLKLCVRNMTASGTCIPNAKGTGLTVIYM